MRLYNNTKAPNQPLTWRNKFNVETVKSALRFAQCSLFEDGIASDITFSATARIAPPEDWEVSLFWRLSDANYDSHAREAVKKTLIMYGSSLPSRSERREIASRATQMMRSDLAKELSGKPLEKLNRYAENETLFALACIEPRNKRSMSFSSSLEKTAAIDHQFVLDLLLESSTLIEGADGNLFEGKVAK